MTNSVDSEQKQKTPRILTALLGAFFVLLAFAIVLLVDQSMLVGAIVAALVIGLLGVDACISAALDRPSLLQRIGPLP